MDIAKVIGIGIIAVTASLIFKQYKPEFSIYISIVAGLIILFFSCGYIKEIIDFINTYSGKMSGGNKFVTLLLKITGLAILSELAISICKDSGENAIATKIEIASKLMIIVIALPIFESLLDLVLKLEI